MLLICVVVTSGQMKRRFVKLQVLEEHTHMCSLLEFDLDIGYGPCCGISRSERYEVHPSSPTTGDL